MAPCKANMALRWHIHGATVARGCSVQEPQGGYRHAVREVAELPLPGSGRTLERFERLAAIARRDPVLARLAEGHADAVAIRAELGDAGATPPDERWGVWAAKPSSVIARPRGDAWTL